MRTLTAWIVSKPEAIAQLVKNPDFTRNRMVTSVNAWLQQLPSEPSV